MPGIVPDGKRLGIKKADRGGADKDRRHFGSDRLRPNQNPQRSDLYLRHGSEKRDERSFDGMDEIEQPPGHGVSLRNFCTRHAC